MKIFRQFDLATDEDLVNQILDNPLIMPIELKVSCIETGYTTILVHAQSVDQPIIRRRKREFKRFVLYGGMSEELNLLLENEDVRVLNRYDFFTEQGVIIVLDYEINPEE